MRFRITLSPKDCKLAALPLNNYPAASLIYKIVSIASPDYGAFLHDQGYSPEGSYKRFKFFVFSRFYLDDEESRKSTQIRDGFLWFKPGPVLWQVSSPIGNFVEAFITGLVEKKIVGIGESGVATVFDVTCVELIEPPAFKEQMHFLTLSPITVSVKEQAPNGALRKHYLRADNEQFGEQVRLNLIEKYLTLTGRYPADDRLEFNFDWDYIRRRGGVERVSKLIQFNQTKIKCYQAPFKVKGNIELIELGWECGFGNANSQGFGMAN